MKSVQTTIPQMRSVLLVIAATMLFSHSVQAAKSWGVSNEKKAVITGVVTDITCHLTGNCPEKCGDGKRQLGLLTKAQGMILVSKNLALYTGAAEELKAFCGKEVEVDGLFTEHRGVRFFQVQEVCPPGAKAYKANLFHKAWAAQYGGKPRQAKYWYKKDPRVTSILEKDGVLGLGLEKDKEFFSE